MCGTTRVAISSSSGKSALAGPSRFAGFLDPPLGRGSADVSTPVNLARTGAPRRPQSAARSP
jgi:hypothetical protein